MVRDIKAREAAIVQGGLPCRLLLKKDGAFSMLAAEPLPGWRWLATAAARHRWAVEHWWEPHISLGHHLDEDRLLKLCGGRGFSEPRTIWGTGTFFGGQSGKPWGAQDLLSRISERWSGVVTVLRIQRFTWGHVGVLATEGVGADALVQGAFAQGYASEPERVRFGLHISL